jgi:hypothetical protein
MEDLATVEVDRICLHRSYRQSSLWTLNKINEVAFKLSNSGFDKDKIYEARNYLIDLVNRETVPPFMFD